MHENGPFQVEYLLKFVYFSVKYLATLSCCLPQLETGRPDIALCSPSSKLPVFVLILTILLEIGNLSQKIYYFCCKIYCIYDLCLKIDHFIGYFKSKFGCF